MTFEKRETTVVSSLLLATDPFVVERFSAAEGSSAYLFKTALKRSTTNAIVPKNEIETEFPMNSSSSTGCAMNKQRRLELRRLRNWKRWGAYLAECEWAELWMEAPRRRN